MAHCRMEMVHQGMFPNNYINSITKYLQKYCEKCYTQTAPRTRSYPFKPNFHLCIELMIKTGPALNEAVLCSLLSSEMLTRN